MRDEMPTEQKPYALRNAYGANGVTPTGEPVAVEIPPQDMTAQGILDAVRLAHYPAEPEGRWLWFNELRMGTGYGRNAETRLDAWCMNAWASSNIQRVAFEAKISRADWRRELRDPLKRRMGLLYSNFFYFVAPVGIIKLEEVPPECGLYEIDPNVTLDDLSKIDLRAYQVPRLPRIVALERVRRTIDAPHRDTPPPGWRFVAALARRALRTDSI